jgi:copper(I)-binding protein
MIGIGQRGIIGALALLGLVGPALAETPAQPQVTVSLAWARALNSVKLPAAAYFTIANAGGGADRLVAAASPVAEHAELMENATEHGVMEMRGLDGLTIEPGQSAVLKPGGLHLMLTGLKQPLRTGDSFPLFLTFAKAGTREVMVKVEKPTAMAADEGTPPTSADMDHAHHHH